MRKRHIKTYCIRGHAFTPENTRVRTRVDGRTYQACRTCLRKGKPRRENNTDKSYCVRGHEFTPENTYFRRGEAKNRGCITCRREVYAVRRNAKNRGVSVEEYKALEEKQKGLCAICKCPEPDKGRRLSLDHDHLTGRNRELLCSHCNRALGGFRDSVDVLLKAVDYLRKHGKESQ